MRTAELVIAGLLSLVAIRSMAKWLGAEYEAHSLGERVLFSIHVVARVGLWLSFAAFFLGYALLDEPQRFQWFFLVPMAMAGVQLMTGLLLARWGGA